MKRSRAFATHVARPLSAAVARPVTLRGSSSGLTRGLDGQYGDNGEHTRPQRCRPPAARATVIRAEA